MSIILKMREQMMSLNQTKPLSNGVDIPVLGLGTWLIADAEVAQVVKKALQLGYRHIDTAQAYENERGVGEGIKLSGIPREQIFLQTKLKAEIKTYKEAKQAIEESFAKLDVDYIDLMIIHCPQPWNEFRSDNHYFEGNLEAWRALEEFYEKGKIKAIGVSNFEEVDIENILKKGKAKPMVNQILTHIGNTPFKLIQYCQEHDIVVEAYSPIAHGKMLKNEEVGKMAKKYGVTIPQLCIRYTLQLGMVSLPKTVHEAYLKANAEVNFVISEEDMHLLCQMD